MSVEPAHDRLGTQEVGRLTVESKRESGRRRLGHEEQLRLSLDPSAQPRAVFTRRRRRITQDDPADTWGGF